MVMRSKAPAPSARYALKKLGEDLSVARRRRRMTQQRVAEGAGIDVGTVRRLEQGHPSVSLGSLAMVLVVLGETDRLAQLLDVGADDLGLALSVETLPKRVRRPRRARAAGTKAVPPAADDGAF